MPGLPPTLIGRAYEANFGEDTLDDPFADDLIPMEEIVIATLRENTLGGRVLTDVMSGHESADWAKFRWKPINEQEIFSNYFHNYAVLLQSAHLAKTKSFVLRAIGQRRQQVNPLQERFDSLVQKWHEETDHLSAPLDIVTNLHYQQIIGMGPSALPLIIKELEARGGYWFWALRAITGIDPVPPEARGKASAMTRAWLSWWKKNGY